MRQCSIVQFRGLLLLSIRGGRKWGFHTFLQVTMGGGHNFWKVLMGVCHIFWGCKRPIQNGVNIVFTSFFDKFTHTFEIISLLLTNCYYIQITPIYIIIVVARLFVTGEIFQIFASMLVGSVCGCVCLQTLRLSCISYSFQAINFILL